MTDKRLLGAFGEQRAALFLRENGYRILSANFRCEGGEIDVIAEKDGIICFVEVKTRTEGAMLPPSSAGRSQNEEYYVCRRCIYG